MVRLSSRKSSETDWDGLPCEGFASRYWMACTFPSLVCGIFDACSFEKFPRCLCLWKADAALRGSYHSKEKQLTKCKVHTRQIHTLFYWSSGTGGPLISGGTRWRFGGDGIPDRPQIHFCCRSSTSPNEQSVDFSRRSLLFSIVRHLDFYIKFLSIPQWTLVVVV